MLTTPTSLFPELSEFRTRLKLDSDAVFVPIRPRADSIPDNCTEDVKRQVEEHGGEAVLGWMIWSWPSIMAEAVFHSVWRSPDGTLLDVNRKTDGEDRVLFFADPKLTYTGKRTDSVRIPLIDHPAVRDLIRTTEQFNREFDAQFGGDFLGEAVIRGKLKELYQRREALSLELMILASTFRQ